MERTATISTLSPFNAISCPFVGIGSHGQNVARVTSGDRFHIYANAGAYLTSVDSWSDVIAVLVRLDGMQGARANAERINDRLS
jgi:hypothetical protein